MYRGILSASVVALETHIYVIRALTDEMVMKVRDHLEQTPGQ